MRFVLRTRFPGFAVDPKEPALIFAARDEASAGLANAGSGAYWLDGGRSGYFVPLWEGNLAIVRLDQLSLGGREAIYEGYVDAFLGDRFHFVPAWLRSGLSQLYGWTRLGKQQNMIGAPLGDWRPLTTAKYVPLRELMPREHMETRKDFDTTPELYTEECWALVHYMTFGSGMEGGRLILEFLRRLESGATEATAFQAVYGDPEKFEAGFRSYLQAKALPAGALPRAPKISDSAFTVRELSPAESAFDHGVIEIRMNNLAHGRTLLEKTLALDPKFARAHEELGFLDYDEGRDDEARAEWESALHMDPTLYRALFAETTTGALPSQQTVAQRADTLKKLQEVVRLEPRYAPAYVRMAVLLWWQGKLDDAYRAAFAAESLEPSRTYDQLVGRILLAQGKGKEAAAVARQSARDSTRGDRDGAIALWERIPVQDRDAGPPLTFDLKVQPLRGTLTRVACASDRQETTIEVQPRSSGGNAGTLLTFSPYGRFSRTIEDSLWIGEMHFAYFSLCRNMVGRPVRIFFQPKGGGGAKLLRVDVVNDLPDAQSDTGPGGKTGP